MSRKTKVEIAHEEVSQRGLVNYSREAMTIYGKYTLEERAIPDFRDGLKPVHRRVLYASYELGLSASKGVLKKSARVVGDAMGKYHPHGDRAVYDAAVGMVHLKNPTMHGSGNFGTLIDPPAAMRYTETRLTEYSDAVFFDPSYVAVMELADNFDGSEQEPVILPASLPNLLLNGIFGIATGGRTSIPAFERDGVVHLAKLAVSGKPVTVKLCERYLIPTAAEGGRAYFDTKDTSYRTELNRFFETGEGSVYWIPECKYNVAQRSISVTGFCPQVAISLGTILNNLAVDEDVADVIDESDIDERGNTKLAYRVTLKKSIPAESVEDTLVQVQAMFEGRQPLIFAVNERSLNSNNETDVTFEITNMPDFFRRWADWRIALERRAITYQIETVQRRLERDEMLLLAVVNRDVIIKALDRDDTADYLVRVLKITLEQVNMILDLKVRQLKRLEGEELRRRIAEHRATIKTLQAEHDDPVARVHRMMDAAAETAA